MKKIMGICLLVSLLVSCSRSYSYMPAPPNPQMVPDTPTFVENQVIVKYKSGFGTQATSYQLKGSQVLDSFNTSDEEAQLHQLPPETDMEQALQTYRSNQRVEFAIPNVRFQVHMESGDDAPSALSSDPMSKDQWYLKMLEVDKVWPLAQGKPVTVAVLDTGVDYHHPDLKDKVILGPDYVDKDNDPKDMHGHGTHVAGIIAAGIDNAQGVAGVAPNVNILAIRILDANGAGSLFYVAKAIAYAANKNAQVINLSLGSPPGGVFMRSLANLLAYYAERKGSLIIAAAGNDGSNIGLPAAASKFVAVGAINSSRTLASFSNRGKEMSVVAPGVDILSTFPTYPVTANEMGLPMNYASLNGTSMATPIVSAQAALIWSHYPTLKPQEIRTRIESTATDLGKIGKDDTYGYGLIDIVKSLQPESKETQPTSTGVQWKSKLKFWK